jgi:ABC-type nitrate/sulfonate/bicarbonate transport system substrate-binding protein
MARREGLEQVFFAADEIPEVPVSGIGTSLTLMSERPEMVKNFLAGTLDTMDYMKDPDNKEELITYYMERWEFERDLAEESYNVLIETQTDDGQITEPAQQENVKLVAQAAEITEEVPINQVWDFALLKEVLATRTN